MTLNAPTKPILALAFAAASLFASSSYAETDAELMASGQWRDPATGLIWMRCSIGQTWTGGTCSGTPITLNWQDANDYFELFNQDGFAGHKNWRLPKIEELAKIRICSKGWGHDIKFVGGSYKDLGIQKAQLPKALSVPHHCAQGSSAPTVNVDIFPNTSSLSYWSATPSNVIQGNAWNIHFHNGHLFEHYKHIDFNIRLVRSNQ